VNIRFRHRAEKLTEVIDHAVERLVRNRLAFVAAAAKDDEILSSERPREERLDERALADARRAMHADRHGLARARLAPGAGERLERLAAPDERRFGFRSHRDIRVRRVLPVKKTPDLRSRHAFGGIVLEQSAADHREIVRKVVE
jgi:hypothetical protein